MEDRWKIDVLSNEWPLDIKSLLSLSLLFYFFIIIFYYYYYYYYCYHYYYYYYNYYYYRFLKTLNIYNTIQKGMVSAVTKFKLKCRKVHSSKYYINIACFQLHQQLIISIN